MTQSNDAAIVEKKMGHIEVRFPKHYRPLPSGYSVVWSEFSEMFLGLCEEKDIESPIFCCKYMARRWCFANAAAAGEVAK
jgi:hypothetical protein